MVAGARHNEHSVLHNVIEAFIAWFHHVMLQLWSQMDIHSNVHGIMRVVEVFFTSGVSILVNVIVEAKRHHYDTIQHQFKDTIFCLLNYIFGRYYVHQKT